MLTTGLGDEITISDLPEGYSQYFAVDATMGQRITAAVYGISAGEDWSLFIYNSGKEIMASSFHSGSTYEYCTYTVQSAGRYTIRVKALSVGGTSSSCKFKVIKYNPAGGMSSCSDYSQIS